MPFVRGFLRVVRRGGHPDNSLPGVPPGEVDNTLPEVDPPTVDNGLPGDPNVDHTLPEPPPGIWPPPTINVPVQPLPEPGGGASQLPALPPGQIWPPVNGPSKKMIMLVWIPGMGFKYVVVDPGLKPEQLPGDPPMATPRSRG